MELSWKTIIVSGIILGLLVLVILFFTGILGSSTNACCNREAKIKEDARIDATPVSPKVLAKYPPESVERAILEADNPANQPPQHRSKDELAKETTVLEQLQKIYPNVTYLQSRPHNPAV